MWVLQLHCLERALRVELSCVAIHDAAIARIFCQAVQGVSDEEADHCHISFYVTFDDLFIAREHSFVKYFFTLF